MSSNTFKPIKTKLEKDKAITKPQPKPEKDFSIASMLKDLRNEKTNMVENDTNKEVAKVENNRFFVLPFVDFENIDYLQIVTSK